MLKAYSVGRPQRLVSALEPATGLIFVHDVIELANAAYRGARITLPERDRRGDAGYRPTAAFQMRNDYHMPSGNKVQKCWGDGSCFS